MADHTPEDPASAIVPMDVTDHQTTSISATESSATESSPTSVRGSRSRARASRPVGRPRGRGRAGRSRTTRPADSTSGSGDVGSTSPGGHPEVLAAPEPAGVVTLAWRPSAQQPLTFRPLIARPTEPATSVSVNVNHISTSDPPVEGNGTTIRGRSYYWSRSEHPQQWQITWSDGSGGLDDEVALDWRDTEVSPALAWSVTAEAWRNGLRPTSAGDQLQLHPFSRALIRTLNGPIGSDLTDDEVKTLVLSLMYAAAGRTGSVRWA